MELFRFRFKGLGGHSSDQDAENPIEYSAKFFEYLRTRFGNSVRAVYVNGGTERNKVPRECTIGIMVDDTSAEYTKQTILDYLILLHRNFPNTLIETGMKLSEKIPDYINEGVDIIFDDYSGNQSLVEYDYRPVPRQLPDNLATGSQRILENNSLNASIKLTRDTYPLQSRFDRLTDKARATLLECTSSDKPKGGNFSTEAGTVVSRTSDVVPVIFSTADINQAHKGAEEYATVSALADQLRIYGDFIRTLGSTDIQSRRIYVSEATRVSEKMGIDEADLRDHLDWFREQNIFAALRLDESFLRQHNGMTPEKIRGFMSILCNDLGLYPLIMSDSDMIPDIFEGLNIRCKLLPVQKPDEEALAKKGYVVDLIGNKQLPVIRKASEMDMDAFSSKIVKGMEPLKYVLFGPSGIYDKGGHIISRLDMNRILQSCGESFSDFYTFAGNLLNRWVRGDMYGLLYRLYNHFMEFDENARPRRSVQVVSEETFMGELFTLEGSGTLVRYGYETEHLTSIESANVATIQNILEEVYQKALRKDYFVTIKDSLREIVLERTGSGLIIVTGPQLSSTPDRKPEYVCLDKVAVLRDYWRQDLPEHLIEYVVDNYNKFYWRDFEGSPVNQWSRRIKAYVDRKNSWTSSEEVPHQSGRKMDINIVGLNPFSEKDANLKMQIKKEAFERPVSFV